MSRRARLAAAVFLAGTMASGARAQDSTPPVQKNAFGPSDEAPAPPPLESPPRVTSVPPAATPASADTTLPAATAPMADAAAPSPPVSAVTTGEAAQVDAVPADQRDPLQGFNRAMWGFNNAVDKVVLKPVTTVYRAVIPRPARRGLSHILANLSEPWTAINSALQAKPKRMLNAIGRFVINTTLGVGGLADPASKLGLPPEPEDFGQTLAVWGAKTSTYLVLPLLGPSTIRDGVGSGVAQFADPYRIALRHIGLTRTQRYGVVAVEAVDARSNLIDSGADAVLKSSADPYATARSAYLQRRALQIADEDRSGADAASGSAGDASVDAALKDLDANAPPTAVTGGEAGSPPPAAPQPETPHEDTPTPIAPK